MDSVTKVFLVQNHIRIVVNPKHCVKQAVAVNVHYVKIYFMISNNEKDLINQTMTSIGTLIVSANS